MRSLSLETVAHMRQDYIDDKPVAQICADYGVSHGTLYFWLDGGPIEDERRQLAPIPRRRDVVGRRQLGLKAQRMSLVSRMLRTAERQVRGIEKRLALKQQEPAERERDTRMLAILVKTLRELSAFDAVQADQDSPGTEDDDIGPRDIDEFRRELVQRMDAIVGRRADRAGREP